MKLSLKSEVKIVPSIAPVTDRIMILTVLISACGDSIQSPGSVKASPPATIAPELIRVWVVFISSIVEFLAFFKAIMLRTVTKTVGHGRAPILSATYIDEEVIITNPRIPINRLRTVKEELVFFIALVCKKSEIKSIDILCLIVIHNLLHLSDNVITILSKKILRSLK